MRALRGSVVGLSLPIAMMAVTACSGGSESAVTDGVEGGDTAEVVYPSEAEWAEMVWNSTPARCERELTPLVLEAVDGRDGTGLMLTYGMQSPVYQPSMQLVADVMREQVRFGVRAAVDLAQQRVVDMCFDAAIANHVLDLRHGDDGWMDPELQQALLDGSFAAEFAPSTTLPATRELASDAAHEPEPDHALGSDAGVPQNPDARTDLVAEVETSVPADEIEIGSTEQCDRFNAVGACLHSADDSTSCGDLGVVTFGDDDIDYCPEVTRIQAALVAYGTPVDIDGYFGLGTQQAVMNFQRFNGLDPDGIVGPTTWAALSVHEPTP